MIENKKSNTPEKRERAMFDHTAPVRQIHRSLEGYQKSVQETFFEIDFQLKEGTKESFCSQFETRRLGALDLTRAFASAKSVGYRGRDMIHPKTPDRFLLNIVLIGSVRQRQFGRLAEAPSGFMMLTDARFPCNIEQLATTSAIYIRIPGAPLRASLGTPEDFCSIPIDARNGIGAILRAFVRSSWHEHERLSDLESDAIGARMIDILTSSFDGLRSKSPKPVESNKTTLYEKAMRFIESNLGDPQLTPNRIADALKISPSHLHKVARGKGPTVGRIILSKRLQRCREMLCNPQLAHRTITEIAFDCGFNDSAHFSRTFKAQFELSPRDYRKLHLSR